MQGLRAPRLRLATQRPRRLLRCASARRHSARGGRCLALPPGDRAPAAAAPRRIAESGAKTPGKRPSGALCEADWDVGHFPRGKRPSAGARGLVRDVNQVDRARLRSRTGAKTSAAGLRACSRSSLKTRDSRPATQDRRLKTGDSRPATQDRRSRLDDRTCQLDLPAHAWITATPISSTFSPGSNSSVTPNRPIAG